jgi:hypothetical protein
MVYKIIPQGFIKFIILVLVTIALTYVANPLVASLWYILLLVLYWRSADEAFWFAFFLVTVDGFMGFLGVYTVTIKAIPGLPAIELAQFYIILSVLKARRNKSNPPVFYRNYLWVLLCYLIFMIVWGQAMGFSGELKGYFRLLKFTFPFILFYSLPRLLIRVEYYERIFGFLFIVLILGFFTQAFTLVTGLSPAGTLNLTEEQISEAGIFRGFYNITITLMGLFGALFFLSYKQKNGFSTVYLYIVIIAAYGMAFLSATRGWILSFSLIIISTFIFSGGIKVRKTIGFIFISALLLFAGLSNQKIMEQVLFSKERFLTMESLAEGDITAGGTLQRLSVRGPRVMKIWKENPVFGWGFSTYSREHGDVHVANQTLLMTSGIVGYILLNGFFLFFILKLGDAYIKTVKSNSYRNVFMVFIIFLCGWFVIHSTSGQHFNYSGIPVQIMPQALFFSFGALIYSKNLEFNGKKI